MKIKQDDYLFNYEENEQGVQSDFGVTKLERLTQSKKDSLRKTSDYNILLAANRKHGRYRLAEPYRNPYDQHLFYYTDLFERKVVGKFKIEPYLLINSLVSYKTIKEKKKEIKSVKEKIESTLGVSVSTSYSTFSRSPFIYTFFCFVVNGKYFRFMYVDESFYKKDYSGNTEYNLKYMKSYSQKLHATKVNSPYYKQYIKGIVETFLKDENKN